ncbi:MAG: putative Ig domain-containing protein, partial [Acidobacteriia bacterium]|nr:putative Ig domain-containing protein [Terriglobia bacterium]
MKLTCNVGRWTKSRAALLTALLSLSFSAWGQISPCDLNGDGVINVLDVTRAVNMVLGIAPCTANIEGPNTCTVVTVQRVVNTALGQACVVYNLPSITSALSASGTVGTAFSYQITATNTPTSYGATGLPTGLSINTATGLISGTPTSAGTSAVTLGATNGGGTGNATLTLTITAAPPVITSATTANGTVGTAFSYQITATN